MFGEYEGVILTTMKDNIESVLEMELPEEIQDNVLGSLKMDDNGTYIGELAMFNEIVRVEIWIETDEDHEIYENIFYNAHMNLEWIRKNHTTLFRQAAEALVWENQNENTDHPMWFELFKKQVNKIMPLIKIVCFKFNLDEKFSIVFDDGEVYDGMKLTHWYSEPNILINWFIERP